MSEEVQQVTLDERMAAVKSSFDELEALRQKEIENARLINQNISKIREEQLRLDGEYRALAGLKDNGEPKGDPKLTIPSKKKK